MAAPEDIDEAIEQNALGPKKVQIGNQSVEQHAIGDQIKAKQHEATQAAVARDSLGIRIRKFKPFYP